MTVDEPVFVDTWGWLALGHRRDRHHEAVMKVFQDLRELRIAMYTTDYVLNELITLIFRREAFSIAVGVVEGIMSLSARGELRIDRMTTNRFMETWRLRKRYHDKPTISFTDLFSMVIMRERVLRVILTEDEHFEYVGLGFQRIP